MLSQFCYANSEYHVPHSPAVVLRMRNRSQLCCWSMSDSTQLNLRVSFLSICDLECLNNVEGVQVLICQIVEVFISGIINVTMMTYY